MTGAALALALSCAAPGAAAAPGRARPVAVYGHRGARARRPENTLAAFDYALRAGADVLEMDARVTKDGAVVVVHDPRLDPRLCLAPDGGRLAEGPTVAGTTLAELRRYDCGSLRHPDFPAQRPAPGARVPTLDEVFALAAKAGRPARFFIEAKTDGPPGPAGPREFAALLAAAARAAGAVERTSIQSFDARVLAALRELEPRLGRAPLSRNPLEDLAGTAASVGAREAGPYAPLVTSRSVAALHARGVRVVAWTANDAGEWERLVADGVDGIITDDPAALAGWLGTRP